MRNLIVSNIISLDGFYEGPGGNVMALPMDHAFDAYNAERLRAADTLLLGAGTFRLFSGFWPAVAENPAASPDQQEISRRDTAIDKLVVSDSLTPEEAGAWRDTSRIVPRAGAHAAVAELKRGEGGDILVFGSRTLWHDLVVAGLVDELHLVVGPTLLGAGTPAFPAGLAGSLELIETRTFDGSGNVVLRYAILQPHGAV
jgi:dihydrofolate reductase